MTQTSPASIRELARIYFDRARANWERGDVSILDEVYSDELVYHMPPFPDLDKVVVDGDTTVQRWHAGAPTAARARCCRCRPLAGRPRAADSWRTGAVVRSRSCGTSGTGWDG